MLLLEEMAVKNEFLPTLPKTLVGLASVPGFSPSMGFSWNLLAMAYVSPLIQKGGYPSLPEMQDST